MKKISFSLLLITLILCTSTVFPQIRNLKSMEGTWTGQWVNLYYLSDGSITLTMTVNESAQTAHGDWTVGGNILGVPRNPFSTDITLTPTGFVASFTSPIWGDISGEGTYAGVYAGTAVNCPNPNAQSIIASGYFSPTHIYGSFAFTWYLQPITGTVIMSKQDSIIAPTGLAASEHPQGTVNLHWTDNATNETGFRVDRKSSAAGVWSEIGTTGANDTSYTDNTVQVETQYTYRVTAYDATTESEYSDTVALQTTTAVENTTTIPSEYSLLQNYPNPFNPSTVVTYDVPRDSRVNISVYSLSGELLATLVNDLKAVGRYEVGYTAQDKASGIYLLKMVSQSLETGKKYIDIKKMVLMK
jgi:hypothetical protein